MSDQAPQNGNERAGFDAAPDVELDPAIERELRAMSAWDGEVPKPSLAARALAEHDEEMHEVRARRSWTRQGGLMAAAVAIAGLGLSIGFVSTNKPVERMNWSVASRGDAFGRSRGADRDGQDEERSRMARMTDASGDPAGAARQQAADQMQGQVRQLKVGEPASQVAARVPEPAPASSAAPAAAPPGAPAAASAEPKAAETGTRGAPDANALADGATGAAGQGTEAAKKSETSDAKAGVGGKDDGASKNAMSNNDAAPNTGNRTELDGVTNDRRFGTLDGPGGEVAPVVARPTGGTGGLRGEMVQPGAADWAAYVGRSLLLGMPWILLGAALVAIARIRMRR